MMFTSFGITPFGTTCFVTKKSALRLQQKHEIQMYTSGETYRAKNCVNYTYTHCRVFNENRHIEHLCRITEKTVNEVGQEV